MKFGLLDFNKTVQWYWDNTWNKKALLNIGDAAEYKVIEQFYHDLEITDAQIIKLSIHELVSYRGESLIVALNIALDSYVGYNDILDHLSPDIVPVFLGMSLTNTEMNDAQLQCLRTYAPVGCRDQRSYDYLKQKGIDCYLNGCCVSVLRPTNIRPDTSLKDKVLFIDVPQSVASYVPEKIRKNAVFFNQEIYCTEAEMPNHILPEQWAQSILNAYSSNIKAVVTSRFHGAVLALSLNIPVVLTLEKKTFRFSWLEKYCQMFEEGEFERIDWSFPVWDFTKVKEQMNRVCLRRIAEVADRYEPLLTLTDYQKNQLHMSQNTNNTLYYHKALKQIHQKWKDSDEIRYAFWGINQNSQYIYQDIRKNFPNAKLVDIYDMNREISFEGITSKHPRELKEYSLQNNYYVIITAYLASRVAEDIFKVTGFPAERAFLCERTFLSARDFLN